MSREFPILVLVILCCLTPSVLGESYHVKLVRDGAVIARKGPETGSPSLIQIPSWIPAERRADSTAKYYLYYCGDHREYVCMKWSASVDGPWHEFNLGDTVNGHVRRGVYDLRALSKRPPLICVESVDVQVDHQQKQIVLLYYGQKVPFTNSESSPCRGRGLVALSQDGLDFHSNQSTDEQSDYGPQVISDEDKTLPLWLGPPCQRAFRHDGHWYSISRCGVFAQAVSPRSPWSPNRNTPTAMAWAIGHAPDSIRKNEPGTNQVEYYSPITTFLASNDFAKHPKNPMQGTRIGESQARIDQVGVCVLPDRRLEVFFGIRDEPKDSFNGIYRIIVEMNSSDVSDWKLAQDDAGRILFEVVVTPDQINRLVQAANPDPDPIYYVDPVSLEDPCIFVDEDGRKVLFYSYKSARYGGYEGSGQISAIELEPQR